MNQTITIPPEKYYKVIEICLKNVAAAYGRRWQDILPEMVQTEHKHIALYLMCKYIKIVELTAIVGTGIWYAASVGNKLIMGYKKNKLIAAQVDVEIKRFFDTGYVGDVIPSTEYKTVESSINKAA